MVNIENFKDKLDTNSNWELEEQEIEKWIWIELRWLEKEALNITLEEIAPNYKEEISNLNNKEKIDIVIIFSYAKKILWNDFYNEFLKKGWEYSDVPLNEMSEFITENLLNSKNIELLKTREIILTDNELESLHKAFVSNNKTQELKDFFNEQLDENTTSAEIIQWTSFAKKIESLWKDPIDFIKNIDNVWFNYLQNELPNTSKDTLRNIATWMTFSFIKIFEQSKWKISNLFKDIKQPEKLLKILSNEEWKNFLEKTGIIIDEVKKIENEEQNDILMDSQKFSTFYYDVLTWNKNKEQIAKELTKSQWKYNKDNTNTEELENIANKAGKYITKENLAIAWGLAWLWSMLDNFKNGFEWFKDNIKDQTLENAEQIFGFKHSLESMWVFKYVKEFLDKIFEFVGFDNGWEGFKNEVVSEKFPDVVSYLEKNITLEKIKDNEESIFNKGFKENLTWDKQIKKIKVNWSLSYESFDYLNSKWSWNMKENLNKFFTEKEFDKLFENDNEKKEFYNKAFKIEEQEVKWNWEDKTKTIIWVVDFNMIDKIIPKLQKDKKKSKTVGNYETASASIALDYIEWEEKQQIEQFIKQQETIVSNKVKKTYWITNFSYTKYINAIWIRESSWNYDIKNSIWALWKYQFMPNTLKDYKDIICPDSNCNKEEVFLDSPIIQEQVMVAYTIDHIDQINWKVEIKDYKDLVYYLAKTHLWWVWNVDKNKSDTYGTTQVAYADDVVNYYSA